MQIKKQYLLEAYPKPNKLFLVECSCKQPFDLKKRKRCFKKELI